LLIDPSLQESTMSDSDELAKLAELHQRGSLTEEEFARAKARILDGKPAAGPGPQAARPAAPAADALHALHRSRDDRWLGGVCGGVARVTGLPSWVWRLLFILLLMCAGTGVLLYILLWIFVPPDPVPVYSNGQAG
jgi:phage shock protein PspC (stress-responsive transcriptional regulator)